MKIVTILGLKLHNLTLSTLLQELTEKGGFVVTPNVDHVVKLQQDPALCQAYALADYQICDSKILQYTSWLLGQPIREKLSGSDVFPAFCRYNQNNLNIHIFLLGGKPESTQKAQATISQKIGREIICDTCSPAEGFENDEAECQRIIDQINQSKATVLAVGLGTPKQEKWIAKYKNQLPFVKIFLAIGATIDFESGYKRRAPKWMSQMGLEWFYRLISEPKRLWKRYLVDSWPFFGLVAQEMTDKSINFFCFPKNSPVPQTVTNPLKPF